ncbi:hypothetical protein SAMN04487939_111117 [Lysobacter sp. yr284]|uniref:ribonuclease H-like domain-containing protein n=1 Tax=Lysobacter sp. yr284 TaxID=1761791 RepID=UPI00089AB3E8|nr:ribonuclease H-like domain-containing protein [Lysobacter sp. yr284]SDZ00154.1 hypothetical protein SAMN04487939_111117 [Lysobacter sp. yr284]
MSLDLARLRALQRQAGRSDAPARDDPAAGRDAGAAIADRRRAYPAAAATTTAVAPTAIAPAIVVGAVSPATGPANAAADAASSVLGADGVFGPDGLVPSRPQRTDLDALRRLIALRERKPANPGASNAAAAGAAQTLERNPAARPRATARDAAPAHGLGAVTADRSLPGEEIAPGLHLIQSHLPLPGPREALSLAFAKRPDDRLDPRRLLFFDTETTGLAGGTGTRAFMIGAADWHDDPVLGDGLRIRQLMISTLSAEAAMLREFARWLAPDTVLSSYNGRCYDAPLLNTRYRLARIANPLSGLDHVDLLFPARRLYRGVWENCKLATLERELLRILREDDLPGSQAPAAWLQFLRGGSSALLRRVAAHNHQDVVTLAELMQRLVQAYAQAQAETALPES